MHTHGPHVAITLTEGKIRMTNPDGTSDVADTVPGAAEFTDAIVRNLG